MKQDNSKLVDKVSWLGLICGIQPVFSTWFGLICFFLWCSICSSILGFPFHWFLGVSLPGWLPLYTLLVSWWKGMPTRPELQATFCLYQTDAGNQAKRSWHQMLIQNPHNITSWFSYNIGMGATAQSTKIIVLENVLGFLKVAEKVWKFLGEKHAGVSLLKWFIRIVSNCQNYAMLLSFVWVDLWGTVCFISGLTRPCSAMMILHYLIQLYCWWSSLCSNKVELWGSNLPAADLLADDQGVCIDWWSVGRWLHWIYQREAGIYAPPLKQSSMATCHTTFYVRSVSDLASMFCPDPPLPP